MYDYDYGYGYDYGSTSDALGFIAGIGIIIWIIGMAAAVFSIICMWKLFKKAGKPGWASIIPIYNIIVMLEIAELPMWYIALFFVPFANIYAMFKIYIEIAHKFGKSTGYGIGMIFLGFIFIPMLAFGKAEYKGGTNINVSNNNQNYQVPVNQNDMQNNVQYNVPQSGIMNVNNGFGTQPMTSVNMQYSNSSFQPVGNIDNNLQNMNANSNVQSTLSATNQVMDNSNAFSVPVSNVNTMSSQSNEMNNFVTANVNSVPVQPQMNVANNLVQNSNNVNNDIQPSNLNYNVNLMNQKKTCPNCGNQVEFNTMICNNCGHNL